MELKINNAIKGLQLINLIEQEKTPLKFWFARLKNTLKDTVEEFEKVRKNLFEDHVMHNEEGIPVLREEAKAILEKGEVTIDKLSLNAYVYQIGYQSFNSLLVKESEKLVNIDIQSLSLDKKMLIQGKEISLEDYLESDANPLSIDFISYLLENKLIK